MDTKEPHLFIPFKEVETWSLTAKKDYYENLRNICIKRKKHSTGSSKFVAFIAPLFRNFPIEIRGAENLIDTNVLFSGNHSNSHDVFVIKEVFRKLKRKISPLVAYDGLNTLSRTFFFMSDGTFIDRADKKSIEKGLIDFCNKILKGNDGFMFGESTWNLHPLLPMQKLKAGITLVSLITGKPIIPVIFECVESAQICKKESSLYDKCIVQFGTPYYAATDKNIFEQTYNLQIIMENMRRKLWDELGIRKDSFENINKELYLNHLYLKKFKATGFKYNSELETQFLLNKENEYVINQNGDFVPGILQR